MPKLIFVTGRAGSGKTRCLHGLIKQLTDAGRDAVLIVPEQFTFETERELSLELPGLMEAAVYSFTTLSTRVLKESGQNAVFLSRQGRRMMIRRAAGELKQSFRAFAPAAERPGFAEKCDELFSLFKRFDIAPEALYTAAEKARESDPQLSDKLADLTAIYVAVQGYLGENMLDSDDALNALRASLPHSSLVGKSIIIDGFDMLTEQIYLVIGELMGIADTLYVSVRTGGDCRDSEVFAPEERARNRIYKMAQEAGVPVEYLRMPDKTLPPARFVSPELAHLEHEAFSYPFRPYDKKCENITLFAGTDRTAEVRDMATALIKAAQSGVRFREMAVIATDMAGYLSPVTREFRRRGIPFFTDAKHPLSLYAAPRLVLCALSAVAGAFRREDIVSLMKTGLAGVTPEETDIFENHVLKTGASGSRLTKPFAGREVPEAAERARAAVMGPLATLRQALSSAGDAANKTEALYNYLEELKVYDQLRAVTEELRDSGRRQLMEENAQVYDRLMELLGQIHGIMGDARISVSKYLSIMQEGMEAYDVGAIPTTADQVLFGSVGRTRARSIRALFILGASSGLFPRYAPDEGVIDDRELAEFAALGLTPWDNTSDKNGVELVNVYNAISKPSESLYISWPLREDSDPAMPAEVVDRIREIFPDITVRTDLGALTQAVDAAGGVNALCSRLVDFVENRELPPDTAELYAAVARTEGGADRLKLMESALYHDVSPEPFGQELASELYGNMLYGSATRLEKFNACPFAHFMQYGMKALPRSEFCEQRSDEGSFLHAALSRIIGGLMECDAPVTAEYADRLVDEVAAELIQTHNNGIFLETARYRARSAELVHTLKLTVKAVLAQMEESSFSPVGCEVSFGEGRALPAITVDVNGVKYMINGVIDRLDGATIEGCEYYRVLDYKRRGRKLDYAELYSGLSLQLPLYIAAVEAAGKVGRAEGRLGRAAGLYYMPISVDAVEAPDDTFEKKLMEEFRLKGLTVNELHVVEASGAGGCTLSSRSPTASPGDILGAAEYAKKRAAKTLSKLMEGRADVLPYYKAGDKTSPCKYCDYSSACGFDPKLPGCAYRIIEALGAEEYFRLINAGEDKEAQDGLDE